jgi:hypothetical protein
MMSPMFILSSIAALSALSCFPSSLLSFAWADDPPIIRPTPNFETYSDEGNNNKHAPQSMEESMIIIDANYDSTKSSPRESELQSKESYDYQESKSNKIRQQRQKSLNNNMGGQKKQGAGIHGYYHHSSSQSEYDSYMHWCEKVLGIKSIVEIYEFEYVDHLQLYLEQKKNNNDRTKKKKEYLDPTNFDWLKQYYTTEEQKVDEGNNVNANDNNHDAAVAVPIRLVRGLAAKYDIQPGDIVISIPLYSLLSIPTTIDHDPVLSSILGLEARKRYGWADTSEYELQLLVLAVLYHRSLGKDSPLSHYIDILLGTPTDSFPFLWSDAEMEEKLGTGGSNGGEVIQNARGIQHHVYEMYDEVIGTLVKAHPELFAPPNDYYSKGNSEWIYSYENFQWAFAMVISRHHYLPIHELDDDVSNNTPKRTKHTITTTNANSLLVENQIMHETLSSVTDVAPPASQPTDMWVDEAHNEERVIVQDETTTMVMTDDDDDTTVQPLPIKHSFLAPLADLINFGPPCLKGQYNENERVFEFIATCHFAKGNEVTFWYSSDCSDVIIANFGFMHPLVPSCIEEETKEDWKDNNNKQMREQKDMLETELWQTYEKVDLLKDALTKIEKRLLSCGCEGEEKKQQQQTESMTVTGGEPTHKLRKNGHHQALRQEGRTQQELDQQQILTQQIEEELG